MRQDVEQFLNHDMLHTKVAVIGDVMTDRYITGSVNRISPEAPVPVNLVQSERSVLGGAANTAANLSSLGCQVYMAGMRGDDRNGTLLAELLQKAGIDDGGLLVSPGYQTTTKVRILGARQQMMRLDFEEKRSPSPEEERMLLTWLDGLLRSGLGAIVLSDYGKGMITKEVAQQVIQKGASYHVPVLVDPKGSDWTKYEGAYGITPNLKELSDCAGDEIPNEEKAIETEGEAIRKKFHISHVFVTRSEKGITCLSDAGAIHRASVAQDVFDVSGAGDTVMAVTAAAISCKLPMETVLELANLAAGIAVSKVGTYQVKREELLKACGDREVLPRREGSISWEEATRQVQAWKAKGHVVVFTNGCFDILHRGHVTYLEEAARLGDHLIVGLNSDASVKRLKGPSRPINGEQDRAFMLSALRCVDDVVIFGEDTPEELLSHIKPDILVKGGDYKPEEVAGRQYAGKVEILSFVDGYSTTGTIRKIKGE